MKTIKYGIRLIGEDLPVTFSTQLGSGDFTVDVSYHLSHRHYSGEPIWTCDEESYTFYVLNNPSARYNADYSTPTHRFNPEKYEVVQIEMNITKV